MLYVYDMPMTGKKITKFERFGANFTLENKTKKGNQTFYLFSCPGQEKILVVPFFIEQFAVLQEYVKKLPKAKKYESYKKVLVDELKMTVVDEDNYPSEESSTGSMEILNEVKQ